VLSKCKALGSIPSTKRKIKRKLYNTGIYPFISLHEAELSNWFENTL
jgi:hypothetical protein